jgi:hypothetical protein
MVLMIQFISSEVCQFSISIFRSSIRVRLWKTQIVRNVGGFIGILIEMRSVCSKIYSVGIPVLRDASF